MRLVIVTGMSGAGKTAALKIMEDIGYYCVDNLPVALIPVFADFLLVPNEEITKVALGIDVRSGQMLDNLNQAIIKLDESGIDYEILFLDAADETLIKRFKETRRNHPLSVGARVEEGIAKERERIGFLRKRATYILDTTHLLSRDLKKEMERIFSDNSNYRNLYITILSFGFKNGIPTDADLVFDVRCLPNPYYLEELRPLTGNDEKVREYVMADPVSLELKGKLMDLITFLIPQYIREGKNQLVIAVGCTGGKHRSVTIANELFEGLTSKDAEYGLRIEHRDIGRDALLKAK